MVAHVTLVCLDARSAVLHSLSLGKPTAFKSILLQVGVTIMCSYSRSSNALLSPCSLSSHRKLYCMYTKPIGDIIKKHNFNYHCDADDMQIYFSMKLDENWGDVSVVIEACMVDVGAWGEQENATTEARKSELIVFLFKHQLPRMSNLSLMIEGRQVSAVLFVRILSVILNNELTMEKHLNTISKSYFYHIRNIG